MLWQFWSWASDREWMLFNLRELSVLENSVNYRCASAQSAFCLETQRKLQTRMPKRHWATVFLWLRFGLIRKEVFEGFLYVVTYWWDSVCHDFPTHGFHFPAVTCRNNASQNWETLQCAPALHPWQICASQYLHPRMMWWYMAERWDGWNWWKLAVGIFYLHKHFSLKNFICYFLL